jgi:multidrug efflux pump subunit AcrA (membrane-fusion protein)
MVIPGDNHVYTLSEFNGSLVSYAKSTDLDCPMVPVTFRVRNQGNLLSGSFVTLYITTRSDRQALVISNQGIVEEMGNYFVFVQLTPESFEKRLVTLGATDGRCTEILSGVKEGERVVTRGASMVRLAQNGAALDPHAGHVH